MRMMSIKTTQWVWNLERCLVLKIQEWKEMCLKNVFTYTLQSNELNAKCFETYITSFMKMKDTKDNLSNIRTGV